MPTRTTEVRNQGPAECDWADIRAGRPIPVHHVVARHGDEGLEVLRMPLEGRGETLPVFSAGSAARGYLFAEAPGGGWYVKTCTPGELFSLLAGPCARVEWVALDPKLGPVAGARRQTSCRGRTSWITCHAHAPPCGSEGTSPRLSAASRVDERTIGSERREALGEATKLLDLAISRQAEGTRDPEWMIEQARRFIDAGAYMMESEGITENAGPWRTDVPAEVINSLGLENVNFEAADPEVFAWYVKNFVPEANLFVDHSQIVQLATLRRGIWGTKSLWGRVLTYKR